MKKMNLGSYPNHSVISGLSLGFFGETKTQITHFRLCFTNGHNAESALYGPLVAFCPNNPGILGNRYFL